MKKIKGCLALLLLSIVILWSGCADEQSMLSEVPRIASIPSEPKEIPEPEISFVSDKASQFTYNRLSQTEQIWYKDMEKLIGCMGESGRLSDSCLEAGLSETHIDKIFQCLLNDHPEFFYVDGYTYTKYTIDEEILYIDFSANYNMDVEQAKARKAQIEEAVKPILNGITLEATDYDKVKYVYETIITGTEYDLNAPDNQNIYSVFVNHRSVCQGYAKAMQYLLNQLGVECTMVQGSVDTGEGHAWNLVLVDGSFYYVDATWGDAYYQLDGENVSLEGYPEINYDYLCITTRDLMKTHMIQGLVPMPECVDTKDNYYVREGAFFTEYNKEQMKQLFEKALNENRGDVAIKCADEVSFLEVKNALITEYEIFDYMGSDDEKLSYSHNDKWLSMTFWVTNE